MGQPLPKALVEEVEDHLKREISNWIPIECGNNYIMNSTNSFKVGNLLEAKYRQ